MKIVRLEDCRKRPVEMEGVKGAFKQVPLGKADGAPTFSVRVFTVEPGGHTPQHAHPFEHVNYVLEGSGELVSKDGAKTIREGDFVLVDPDEPHQYKNHSDVPLVFMCIVPRHYE
ncbi:MAG: cupin domain-containing protein [Candidatus Eisenbacteria sp.]|nr:cupin domain-containing protein [Candidatus Eisenbacteria bacterium]